jgi:hypothetical protein
MHEQPLSGDPYRLGKLTRFSELLGKLRENA